MRCLVCMFACGSTHKEMSAVGVNLTKRYAFPDAGVQGRPDWFGSWRWLGSVELRSFPTVPSSRALNVTAPLVHCLDVSS